MGFFDQPATPEENVFDNEITSLLIDILKSNKTLRRKPNSKQWTSHIRRLRSQDGVPPNEIKTTLLWYQKNQSKSFVPSITSAKGFRQKYQHLRKAIERGTDAGRSFKLSEDAARYLKLVGLRWRHDAKKDEAEFYQRTFDNYQAHWRGLAALRQTELESNLGRTLAYLLVYLRIPVHQAQFWLHEVHRMNCEFGAWQGNLLNQVWRPTHKRHTRWAIGTITQYVGDKAFAAKQWSEIMEKLNAG